MAAYCEACMAPEAEVPNRPVHTFASAGLDDEVLDLCLRCRPLAEGEDHPDPRRNPDIEPAPCPEGFTHGRWTWDERAEEWVCVQCAIEDIALDRAGL